MAKGGHNGENHSHNDVGSVVVALDGVPVLVDPGRPTYTRQTFRPDRYDLWPMQSRWHDVPLIRGSAQQVGAQHAARDVVRVGDGGAVGLELDLAAAYGRTDVRGWRRRSNQPFRRWESSCADQHHVLCSQSRTRPSATSSSQAGSAVVAAATTARDRRYCRVKT